MEGQRWAGCDSGWVASLGPLRAGSVHQAGSPDEMRRGERGFSLGEGWGCVVRVSRASQGGQPLASDMRKMFSMHGLTGEKVARRRVCRWKKSGRSPFPASLWVERGQGHGRPHSECVSRRLPPIPTLCWGALPALGSFPCLRLCQRLASPPALPRHTCPHLASLPALPAPRVPPSHAHAPLPAPWHWAAEGQAAARSCPLACRSWHTCDGLGNQAPARARTLRATAGSATASPHPTPMPPALPKTREAPGGSREGQVVASP